MEEVTAPPVVALVGLLTVWGEIVPEPGTSYVQTTPSTGTSYTPVDPSPGTIWSGIAA